MNINMTITAIGLNSASSSENSNSVPPLAVLNEHIVNWKYENKNVFYIIDIYSASLIMQIWLDKTSSLIILRPVIVCIVIQLIQTTANPRSIAVFVSLMNKSTSILWKSRLLKPASIIACKRRFSAFGTFWN